MMINRVARIAGTVGMAAVLLSVPACSRIGNPLEALGAKIPPPDEFQVMARKPLVMPATNSLPEPRPGEVSPLEPNAQSDAQMALLGAGGSVPGTGAPSAGEQILLSSANTASASSEIRVQLEEEKIDEKENKPYEAPSLFATLGLQDGEPLDEEQLLDPAVEARRLQSEGKVAPVDPNATGEGGTEESQ